jgi:hypothetical protein
MMFAHSENLSLPPWANWKSILQTPLFALFH